MEAQKIIITGGATRIGAAIARSLSGINKDIVIHYNKSKSKAENLKKELIKTGSKVYLVKGDLGKEKDVNKIVKFAKSKLKYFDCLINNASIFENDKLENFNSSSWEKHLSINLKAPAILSREFGKNIKGKKILITAGPTIEAIDPVRYLSNFSSGKQGYEIANCAYTYGAETILITGLTNIEPPEVNKIIKVQSAKQMFNESMKICKKYKPIDVAFLAAAVSDWKINKKDKKYKKNDI